MAPRPQFCAGWSRTTCWRKSRQRNACSAGNIPHRQRKNGSPYSLSSRLDLLASFQHAVITELLTRAAQSAEGNGCPIVDHFGRRRLQCLNLREAARTARLQPIPGPLPAPGSVDRQRRHDRRRGICRLERERIRAPSTSAWTQCLRNSPSPPVAHALVRCRAETHLGAFGGAVISSARASRLLPQKIEQAGMRHPRPHLERGLQLSVPLGRSGGRPSLRSGILFWLIWALGDTSCFWANSVAAVDSVLHCPVERLHRVQMLEAVLTESIAVVIPGCRYSGARSADCRAT